MKNKKLAKKILKIYLEIRRFTSPFIFKKMYEVPIINKRWDRIKSYSLYEFSKEINSYSYNYDSLYGLFDASFPSDCPEYFFQSLERGRDCDDFARIWRLWAEYQRMEAKEYVFLDIREPFKTAHVVCIAKEKEGKYWLFDYTPSGPFETFESVINHMKTYYVEEYLIYERYRHEKEKVLQ
jgi:hypothetical protein